MAEKNGKILESTLVEVWSVCVASLSLFELIYVCVAESDVLSKMDVDDAYE